MNCNDCGGFLPRGCECSPFGGRRREAANRLRDETYKAMTKPLNHNTPGLDAAVREYLDATAPKAGVSGLGHPVVRTAGTDEEGKPTP